MKKSGFVQLAFFSSQRKHICMKMGIFSSAEVENPVMVNIMKNFRINTLTELKPP